MQDPVSSIHIVPEGDLREHEVSKDCWCKPVLLDPEPDEVGDIYAHNALDGREAYETGERQLS